MWVSVLRAKVKPVAGVVEVGRIRVTDQRAPREPVPRKSLRRLRRGPSVSSRARIASKTRVRCTRLSACLFVFLPSFVIFLSPFAPLFRTGPSRFLLSLPRAFLSFSLRDHPASFFAPVLFLCLSCVHSFSSSSVIQALRFLLHSAPSSLLPSLHPILFSILSLYFPPTFVPLASSSLARSPPTCYLPA